MANTKISQLPAATTLTTADLLPVVQGGATKQVTLDLLPISTATTAALAGKDAAGAAAAAQATAVQRANHTGTQTADTITDGTTNKAYTAVEKTKLAGITAGATINRADTATDAAITAAVNGLINGAPGALDTLKELADAMADDAAFATTVTNALALKAPLASPAFTGTPTGITKTHVGLGNVDNTADTAKPVSTAQAAADALRTIYRGEWAPTTVYAVNDVVTYLGTAYTVTTAHTSSTTFSSSTNLARLSGPRGELAYSESNVNYTITTTATAVPGLDITVTAIDRPVIITAHLPYVQNSTASIAVTFTLYDTTNGEAQKTIVTFGTATSTSQTIADMSFRMPPNGGTRRYQVRAVTSASGATLTNAGDIAYLNAVEV